MKNKYKVEVIVPMIIMAEEELHAVDIASDNMRNNYDQCSGHACTKVKKIGKDTKINESEYLIVK